MTSLCAGRGPGLMMARIAKQRKLRGVLAGVPVVIVHNAFQALDAVGLSSVADATALLMQLLPSCKHSTTKPRTNQKSKNFMNSLAALRRTCPSLPCETYTIATVCSGCRTTSQHAAGENRNGRRSVRLHVSKLSHLFCQSLLSRMMHAPGSALCFT